MRDDSPYDDTNRESEAEIGTSPSLSMPTIPWGWAPASFRSGTKDDELTDDANRDTVAPESERYRGDGPNDGRVAGDASDGRTRTTETEDDSWLDEGMITFLIVTGALLFLFPEPATSAVGIVLLGIGIIAWAADIMG